MKFIVILVLTLPITALGQSYKECIQNNSDEFTCLRIGDLTFDTRDSSFERISKNHSIFKNKNDTLINIYSLPIKTKPKGKEFKKFNSSFLAVTKVKGKIIMIQLYGYSTQDNLNFYGIYLGSPSSEIQNQFGEPVKILPMNDIKSDSWEYFDGRLSFIVKNNTVVTIRITKME